MTTKGEEEKTPVVKQDTLELILASVLRTENEARETKLYAERTHNVSLQMFQEHKALEVRQTRTESEVANLKRQRWTPVVVCVVAALFCLACVFVSAAH